MPKRKVLPKQAAARAEPRASRPQMPKGYGILGPKRGAGLLPWKRVSERMSKARNYWIGTTRADGRPHLMPVWGVWVNETCYFSTDRGSRKSRNLTANPSLVVHLESGDDVVILEGMGEEVSDASLLASIDKAYFAKYGMHVLGIPGDVVFYRLRPRVAFAWQESTFNKCATRWQFDE